MQAPRTHRDTPASPAERLPERAGWRRRLHRLTEPVFAFPLVGALALALLWVATVKLVSVERQSARDGAVASTRELLDTYEAQVVRALREIDQTLKTVQYAVGVRGAGEALADLEARDLLPPSLIFEVDIADATGRIVETTGAGHPGGLGDEPHFRRVRADAGLAVGRPRPDPVSGEWRLGFARRLEGADGRFTGAAILEVDAAYFVSGYDTAKLGRHGLLGLLGADGVFRARRSGDEVSAGETIDYGAVVHPAEGADAPEVTLAPSPVDSVARYATARELYAFPLAVVVGLSEEEHLAAARARAHDYLWRAAAGSGLIILVIAVLGRLSWQLSRARERESEARIEHAERVEYLAYHDALTGLPNRSFFSKLLGRAIVHARRYGDRLAVLFLDLDRFKQINDTLGHEAGDELLEEVAARLQGCLRESDTVARLGGDEFVILLTDGAQAHAVADKVLAEIARPFTLLGQEFRVTSSIGISLYPSDGEDEQTLTKNADIAMYQAKGEGRGRVRFFSEEMSTASLERLSLESSLRRALEYEEFLLLYQPRRELPGGQITGVEALLRWQHRDLGLLEPRKFIPVAEDTGLIVPIGRWVFQTACAQNVAWQREGLPALSIAVNLTSAQFFHEGLLDEVDAALGESGMDPQLLEIEISEGVLTRDIQAAIPILERLKERGVKIVVDNFGTGYSSLSTLRRLPLDSVKIDRVFVRDAGSGTEEREVTDAVVAMGRTLSFRVVAQGVETREQAEFLRRHSLDEVQGFYFNRPVPPEDCAALLRTDASVTDLSGAGTAAGGERTG